MPPVTAWHAWANPALASGRRSRTSVSVATGPSARGRTGGSGALASSSSSSSGAAAGSPDRTAQSTPIRSSPSERASSASHRSDGASAQWTSSTTSTAGLRSPRLLASQTSPRAAACIASPRGRRLARLGCERALRQARCADRQLVPLRAGSQTARTAGAPYPRRRAARAGCSARAARSRRPRRAIRPAAASSVDLPIPAGPSTTITRPELGARASRRLSSASSASRSNNTPIAHTVRRDGWRAPASREKIVEASTMHARSSAATIAAR